MGNVFRFGLLTVFGFALGCTSGRGGSQAAQTPGDTCPPVCGTNYTRNEAPNPIPAENAKPGDPQWRSGYSGNDGDVELYATVDSVEAGDTVGVRVSTRVATQVNVTVYRLGYYGGAGARKVLSLGPYSTARQPTCTRDPQTARIDCPWSDTFSFTVGPDWVSGTYVVRVSLPNNGPRRFTPFVVRDHRMPEIVFQNSFNTSQAYNTYGGESLYIDQSGTMPTGKGHEVTYDRPYAANDGLGLLPLFEHPLLQVLEKNGYNVTYVANTDFTRFSHLLDGVPAFVHGGHDEYWAAEERAQVDAAVASGKTSTAYFGANTSYWRVRTGPSADGRPVRRIICYKDVMNADPIPGSTVRYRDDPGAHPESLLYGSMYESWELVLFPLVVKDAQHWIFQGTNLATGDRLPGLVGNEFDNIDPANAPPDLQVSFESPIITAEGTPAVQQSVDRTTPSGTLVFSIGSIYFATGLDPHSSSYDPRLERVTLNVIERALAHARPARELPAAPPGAPAPTPAGCWATSIQNVAGDGPRGFQDGPGATAQFSSPSGLAVNARGQIFVADTRNNRIRMIDTDPARTVTTIAGTGDLGAVNGPGSTAMFRRPTALAFGPDGSLYVADSGNYVVRRLQQVNGVWNVSTYAGKMYTPGYADGPANSAMFNFLTALAVDNQGNLWIADQDNQRIRFVSANNHQVTTVAGSGALGIVDAANGLQASFGYPSAIALGQAGDAYVYDGSGNTLRWILSNAHSVITIAGAQGDASFADGNGADARFRAQMGMLSMPDGSLLLSDSANYRIRKINPGFNAQTTRVCTFAGSGAAGDVLGPAATASVVAPAGLALTPRGTVLFTDSYHNAIREIVP